MPSLMSPRRMVAGSLTALTLAASGSIGATAADATSTPAAPRIIHTVPSDTIGGLPSSSLDGTTEYIPGRAAGTRQANVAAGAVPSREHPRGSVFPGSLTGYDISWPDCGQALPPDSSIAIVGVDNGHPISQNPCLAQEAAWSPSGLHADYMVLDSPIGYTSAHVLEYAYHGPAGDCTSTDYACQSYNWGYNAAAQAVQYAMSQNADSQSWWLDVEIPSAGSIDVPGSTCYQPNFWVCDTTDNSLVVAGALVELAGQGKIVGEYSTQSQWQQITGGLTLGTPIWIAGWSNPAATYCDPRNASTYWFGGGRPWLVQGLPATYDPDTAC